jgi:predicted CXXCH cytochrome family protein
MVRMRRIIKYMLFPATMAILTASCNLQNWVMQTQETPVSVYKNPHTFCAKCHATEKPKPGGALFAPGADPSATCLKCHDYEENHHPIDFRPDDVAGFPFPLFEDKVKCLTCHEIHGGAGKTGTAKLLRGGPYADRREICFRCHSQEKYAGINPHHMLVDGNKVREINGKPVCLLCHAIMPDPSTDYTDDVRFRADVGFLCWRCHPPMPDPFHSTHFLVKPSVQTLNDMHQAEEREFFILPMVPRRRITCSTCHNPHQQGVIQHEGPAKGADSKHRLRIPSICIPCHPGYLNSEVQ